MINYAALCIVIAPSFVFAFIGTLIVGVLSNAPLIEIFMGFMACFFVMLISLYFVVASEMNASLGADEKTGDRE